MKLLLIPGVLLASIVAPLHAADTAYSALRVYGKKEGEKALYRVVELRGKSGTPQPTSWKLTVDDPQARGGVREFEVRSGRIVGEKAPVGRNYPAPMNFTQLNLDSDGVFTVANQEAEKRGIPFDRIDYILQSGNGGGAPLWTVELFEGRNGKVGTLRIAADSGTIVEQNFGADRRFESDREYVENDRDRRRDPDYRDRNRDSDRDRREREYRDRNDDGDPAAEVGAFFNRVGRHFQKRGRQLSNFFTGKDGDR